MKRKIAVLLAAAVVANALAGCASSPGNAPENDGENTLTDQQSEDITIASTSVAICEILDALEYEHVVAVPETSRTLPERYADLETIGGSMNPDIEIIKSISPDLVLSPQSLESSLSEQYTAAGISSAFLNMSSVQGMYDAIDSLGELLGKEEQAAALHDDYESYMEGYATEEVEDGNCMILMCFPDGFHLIATEKSYVGNLVELAGGTNVYSNYAGDENGFVSINPEDMIQKNPDKIFVFAHYNEKEAFAYMEEEFKTDSTWQYYDAVKNNEIYYLSSDMFGMSATLEWTESLDYLKPILYGE
ncbi:MAG: ABC transporter substrate-binding protein [Eubacterium sp.]|nr:ABC transporter substrate-binding protein [Eubacterium sp.]